MSKRGILDWIVFTGDPFDPVAYRWYCGWIFVIICVLPALIAICITDTYCYLRKVINGGKEKS